MSSFSWDKVNIPVSIEKSNIHKRHPQRGANDATLPTSRATPKDNHGKDLDNCHPFHPTNSQLDPHHKWSATQNSICPYFESHQPNGWSACTGKNPHALIWQQVLRTGNKTNEKTEKRSITNEYQKAKSQVPIQRSDPYWWFFACQYETSNVEFYPSLLTWHRK